MRNLKSLRFLPMALALGCASLGLTACGDSGSSGEFSMDDSFEVVLKKTDYSYKSKDSLLILKQPECKVSSLGYLVWHEKSEDQDSLTAYQRKSSVFMGKVGAKELTEYEFDGKSFPKGFLYASKDSENSLRYGTRIDDKQMKSVFQYDGSCFMKSYYSKMLKDIQGVKEADKALSKLYLKFQKNADAELDSAKMIDDIRVPSCDELALFDGEVLIKVDYLKASSGKITLKYGKAESCPITFSIRYANNESDCSAAYDDYESDKSKDIAEDEFVFDDYARVEDFSAYCIESLVLLFKKDKGILKKTEAIENDGSVAKDVARSAVNLILDGLKD